MKIKLSSGIESQRLHFRQINNSNIKKVIKKKSADSLQIRCTSLRSLLLFFYAKAGMFVPFFYILSKNELPVAKMSFVSPPEPPSHNFRAICKN